MFHFIDFGWLCVLFCLLQSVLKTNSNSNQAFTLKSFLIDIRPKMRLDWAIFFLLLCTKSSHVWIYLINKEKSPIWLQNQIFFKLICAFLLQVSCTNSPTVTPGSGSNSSLSPIGPISRPKCFTNGSFCSESTTSSVSSPTSNYPKAPGFEREDQVHMVVFSSPY